MAENKSSNVENIRFTENLQKIDAILNRHKIEYSLVGGLALKAILGEAVPARRKNGTVHDFDAIAIGPDSSSINQALTELTQVKGRDPLFPEIGIEPIAFSDKPVPYGPLTTLSTMRRDKRDRFFLVYRDIEVPIASETMAVKRVKLNGIELPVLPEKTIFYRYLVRGGLLKMKDDDKLNLLARHISSNKISNPNDELYAAYMEFVSKIGEEHPLPLKLFETFWKADHALGELFSSAPGMIYGLIPFFKEKK